MNRKELVNAVAAHTGLDAREVDKALRGTTEVIEAVAAKGEQVTIMGLRRRYRRARTEMRAANSRKDTPTASTIRCTRRWPACT